jgi:3-demethoxyubiquinol 3-hydroxylase
MPPDLQSKLSDQSSDQASTMCVMFDGSCPLCRREISVYQSSNPREQVKWVDVSLPGRFTQADRERLMARFHVQQKDGTWLSGAAAFVALWSVMPGWRWLAASIKALRLTNFLEILYKRFLKVRPTLQRFAVAGNTSHLPPDLVADIRSDHAGETGAVYIYKGILAVTRDAVVIDFARRHLATEQEHLRQLNLLLPPLTRSWLLPGWKIAGFVTGALPAMVGARAVFATIAAVETFVDQHYEHQIQALAGSAQYTQLRNQLLSFQGDEIEHRDEALANQNAASGKLLNLWCSMVGTGSQIAVKFARLI